MATRAQRPPVLQRAIAAGATNPPGKSLIHGEEHWKGVVLVGATIAMHLGDPDLVEFVVGFAVLHDICRKDEGHDPEHGPRAARLFRRLVKQGLDGFPAGAPRTKDMAFAIEHHSSGRRSDKPNIAACWDADRLLLWRVGVAPDNSRLSTRPALDPNVQAMAYQLCVWQAEGRALPGWTVLARSIAIGAAGAELLAGSPA